MRGTSNQKNAGFALIELLVVALIMLVVTAIAAPRFIDIIHSMRLRSSASTASGIFQAARQQAVKDNTYYYVCNGTSGVATVVWASQDQNSTCSTPPVGTRKGELGQDIQVVSTGMPSGLTSSTLGYTPQAQSVVPAFNGRGVPCKVIGGTCLSNDVSTSPQTVVGFIMYLKDTRPSGNGWAAVAVSPAGRVQIWRYSGSTWSH
jgi:prepilin-type N-terminal cleavage/methylation domain-containing protein